MGLEAGDRVAVFVRSRFARERRSCRPRLAMDVVQFLSRRLALAKDATEAGNDKGWRRLEVDNAIVD